jgi:hypothetical protein
VVTNLARHAGSVTHSDIHSSDMFALVLSSVSSDEMNAVRDTRAAQKEYERRQALQPLLRLADRRRLLAGASSGHTMMSGHWERYDDADSIGQLCDLR